MNYQETLSFLYSRLPAYQRIGKAAYKEGLGNTEALDTWFGHPHRGYLTVHVAGTNGKGSVSHMLASVFQTMGMRTGLYTSPHLRDFRERIRVNGLMMPEGEVIRFVHENLEIIESVSPSFFELTVAMAFDYFLREKVEVAVIEVGMGGRLDSTNIITPVLSVITNIGHDHMEFLGDTLSKVAAEKGGIIKHGVPVVIGESNPETRPVFARIAEEKGAPISFADDSYTCNLGLFNAAAGNRGYTLKRNDGSSIIEGLIPLAGDYQARNLVTVAQAAAMLPPCLIPTVNQLTAGIENVVGQTSLQGRWQVLGTSPLIIADTGHNHEGIDLVMKQIKALKYEQLHIVIGVVNDKDLSSVLPLLPKNAVYYFTKASLPRALDENILRQEALPFGLTGNSYPTVEMAFAAARSAALPGDMVFVGGSTFVVAEVV